MEFVAAPARLSTADAQFEHDFAQRLHWSADTDAAIEQRVADILADVQQRGDAAVLEYTARFDGLQADSMAALELTKQELKAAFDSLPQPSAKRWSRPRAVRSYHEAQKKANGESWSYRDEDGTLLGQKVTPLDRVGIYVPGGKAAYPSSVLMNAIPAHVAGVQDIIMVVPTPKARRTRWCWPPPMWPACTAPSPSAAPRPWRRWPTARPPCPRWTRSPAPAMPMWPAPRSACSASWAST
jgi:histidinol dehydrogenase